MAASANIIILMIMHCIHSCFSSGFSEVKMVLREKSVL